MQHTYHLLATALLLTALSSTRHGALAIPLVDVNLGIINVDLSLHPQQNPPLDPSATIGVLTLTPLAPIVGTPTSVAAAKSGSSSGPLAAVPTSSSALAASNATTTNSSSAAGAAPSVICTVVSLASNSTIASNATKSANSPATSLVCSGVNMPAQLPANESSLISAGASQAVVNLFKSAAKLAATASPTGTGTGAGGASAPTKTSTGLLASSSNAAASASSSGAAKPSSSSATSPSSTTASNGLVVPSVAPGQYSDYGYGLQSGSGVGLAGGVGSGVCLLGTVLCVGGAGALAGGVLGAQGTGTGGTLNNAHDVGSEASAQESGLAGLAGAGALDLCLLGNCLGAGAGLALGDATASGTGGALKPRAIATGKPRPFIS